MVVVVATAIIGVVVGSLAGVAAHMIVCFQARMCSARARASEGTAHLATRTSSRCVVVVNSSSWSSSRNLRTVVHAVVVVAITVKC